MTEFRNLYMVKLFQRCLLLKTLPSILVVIVVLGLDPCHQVPVLVIRVTIKIRIIIIALIIMTMIIMTLIIVTMIIIAVITMTMIIMTLILTMIILRLAPAQCSPWAHQSR